MANLKIFGVIVFFMAVLYVGLEWLPTFFIAPSPSPLPELSPEEAAKQARMGVGIIGYFLLLSLLIYIKILMQRSKH